MIAPVVVLVLAAALAIEGLRWKLRPEARRLRQLKKIARAS